MKCMLRKLSAFAALLGLALVAGCEQDAAVERERVYLVGSGEELLEQDTVQASYSPDFLRPNYGPQFVSAAAADLELRDIFLGFDINGEARAYPVRLLNVREMVEDVVGGVPVFVTWWSVCYTGLVHERRVNGEALTFGNCSQLYKLNMTWWDHETGSVWTQLLAEALLGPLAGARLEQLPAFTGPWQTWRDQPPRHPGP